MNLIRFVQGNAQPDVDLSKTYDAIVIGSGAAGGMAAHVLTSQGMKVLHARGRQEARHRQGAEVDGVAVRASAPRRHAAGPSRADAQRVHDPQAAVRGGLAVHQGLLVRAGLERLRLLEEHRRRREGASVHRHATTPGCARGAWAGRRTSGDGWRCGCPTTTSRRRPTTATARTGRSPTRTSRRTTTASISISASRASRRTCRTCPTASSSGRPGSTAAEVTLRNSLKKMDRVLTPYRAGVTTDGLKHNKYRSRCFGRGACNRRAGGCDIHAAFDSPTGLIYPAMDTGQPDAAHELDRARGPRRPEAPARRAASRSSIPRADADVRGAGEGRRRGRVDARVGAAAAALEVDAASRTASATRAATSATTSAST